MGILNEKCYIKYLTFSTFNVLGKLSVMIDCYYYCYVIIYVLFIFSYSKQNKTCLENNGYKKKNKIFNKNCIKYCL